MNAGSAEGANKEVCDRRGESCQSHNLARLLNGLFFIYNHLYYQELSRKHINFYLSAVLEGALKTAQIYTDLINDWIQIGYYSIVLKSVSMLLKCNYEEVFIRQFYLDRNSFGYYRVYFIDPVTGIRDSGKSTHTKYKIEATMIATSWLQNVAPDCVFTSNR